MKIKSRNCHCFFFQAEDGIRDDLVTGVQTCALPLMLVGGIDELVNPHFAFGRIEEGVQMLNKRALSAAGSTHKGDELPFVQMQIDIAKSLVLERGAAI